MRTIVLSFLAMGAIAGFARADLITNGDFSGGLTGWSTFYGDTGTTATGVNETQASLDSAVGNPAPSGKMDRISTASADNKDFLYQLVPVTAGEQYQIGADWQGDIMGAGGTATNARNWAEVYVGFFPSGTTITDATAQLPDSLIQYKKRWDIGGGSGTFNVDQATGTWTWESILNSTDASLPGPADGIYTATDSLMFVGFNLGGRANSGVANFNVDNVSVTLVPEPASLGLAGAALLLLRRRRRA